jgi:hypothetical protein
MKLRGTRPWILVYSIIFLFLSVLIVQNDIENKYHPIYVIYFIVNYLFLNLGNILYSFKFNVSFLQRYWKIFANLFVLNLIFSILVDDTYGAHASKAGIIMQVVNFIIVVCICLPAFIANYRIAYKE